MKNKILFNCQDLSSTGYVPRIQSSTGTICDVNTSTKTSEHFFLQSSSVTK